MLHPGKSTVKSDDFPIDIPWYPPWFYFSDIPTVKKTVPYHIHLGCDFGSQTWHKNWCIPQFIPRTPRYTAIVGAKRSKEFLPRQEEPRFHTLEICPSSEPGNGTCPGIFWNKNRGTSGVMNGNHGSRILIYWFHHILHLKWSSLMKSFECKGVRLQLEDTTSHWGIHGSSQHGHDAMEVGVAHLHSQRIWMEKPATFRYRKC